MALEIKGRTYEMAIRLLNSLQSNASTLKAQRTHASPQVIAAKNLEQMKGYLSLLTLDPVVRGELNVIHIAGTKGKGSTAAYCESILRNSGLSTGLYTSPHLMHVS